MSYSNPTAEEIAAEVAIEAALRDEMATESAQQSFEDTLAGVNPADSHAALAMLDFLIRTGRLNRIGVLDGGAGYMFVYQEPKGATKAGYRPGGTQGDRIVDAAVDRARASGKVPDKRGICRKCVSAIHQGEGDEFPLLDDVDDHEEALACSAGEQHIFAG